MYGLDLFSGIGGLTKALEGYVKPVAYCENNRYAQAVLLSKMARGELPAAPIWDDVETLTTAHITPPEIIYGGFPCQDISTAGRGAGLDGKRSRLFFEIIRLASEIQPRFVFLENVPAIRTRGADVVVGELAHIGYDSRWITLSAAEIGANHRRERWWLLANTQRAERWTGQPNGHDAGRQNAEWEKAASGARASSANGGKQDVAHTARGARQREAQRETGHAALGGQDVADATCGRERPIPTRSRDQGEGTSNTDGRSKDVADAAINGRIRRRSRSGETPSGRAHAEATRRSWWAVEPAVGRVVNGLPARVDRLRALGNAVVPAQAREAFEKLMGIKG